MKYLYVFFLCLSCVSALSPLEKYVFDGADKVDVPGNKNKECDDISKFTPSAPGIALALEASKCTGCCSDGRYNDMDYTIETGLIGSWKAYRVSAPKTKASKFRVGRNTIFFSFEKAGSYKVYLLEGAFLTDKGTIKASAAGKFVKSPLIADVLHTIVVAPAAERVSTFHKLAKGAEGAILSQDSDFRVTALRWDIPDGQPDIPSKYFNMGPGEFYYRYGTHQRFFRVFNGKTEGVVWQDWTTRKIFVSWLGGDLLSVSNVELTTLSTTKPILVAAAGNGKGEVAYILVGENPSKADRVTPTWCKGVKVASDGKLIVSANYNTRKAEDGLDLWRFGQSGASLVWNTDRNELGLIITRTMSLAEDGLNHQGAIAVVLDDKMKILKNLQRTSAHSWATTLRVGENGKFLGADLGDNFPRGLSVHEFGFDKVNDKGEKQYDMKSKIVYTFKTKHCMKNPCAPGHTDPIYEAISSKDVTFYQSSNDNSVYTEMAHGVVEVDDDALLVFFAGEQPPLDNSLAKDILNAPYNLGFVKVPRNMTDKSVLSPGPTETGGYYDFGANWRPQKNKGVNWLTDFTKKKRNVSRLKAIKLSRGKILLAYEIWTGVNGYVSSQLMTVDNDGKILTGPRTVKVPYHLPYSDELSITERNTAVFFAGAPNGKLARYEISLVEGLGAASGRCLTSVVFIIMFSACLHVIMFI